MDTEKFKMGWLIASLENLHGTQRAKTRRTMLNLGFQIITKGRRGLMARASVRRDLVRHDSASTWSETMNRLGCKFWFTCRAAWERSWVMHGRDDGTRAKPPTSVADGKVLIVTNHDYATVAGTQADIETLCRAIINGGCRDSVRGILLA